MRSRRKRIVALVAGVMAVIGIGVGVVAAATLRGFERVDYDVEGARDELGVAPNDIPRPGQADEPDEAVDPAVPEPEAPDDDRVFLVVGSDGRPGDASSRADVILLGIVPASADDEPTLVSLPRDLWIDDLCAGGRQRINVALAGCGSHASGEELMMLTVERFTGLTVDHYLKVDFDGFRGVIDAVGGVDICTDHPVRDDDLSLPGGCVEADGDDALAWVRSRATQEQVDGIWRTKPGVNDLVRNERQQDVLLQVFERATSRWSLPQLHAAARSLSDTVVLDENLGLNELVAMAWRWRDIDADDIQRVTLDVEPHTTSGGAEVLLPQADFGELMDSVDVDLDRS